MSESSVLSIVCPKCAAANRVPAARLLQRPKCGRCHHQLFYGEPVELDAQGFERFRLKNDIPLLIDFWAPWCGPCVQMAPAFAAAASLLEPRVRLAKLNTEIADTLSGQLGIRSIPTLILFQGVKEVARHSGAMTTQQIKSWLETTL